MAKEVEEMVCGPFAKGTKCKLSAIKSVAHGTKLLTVLFFLATSDKLLIVYPDDRKPKFHDTLTENGSYFMKNVSKKNVVGIENLYEANDETVITQSKRPIKTDHSYSKDEIKEIMRLLTIEDITFQPPPLKKAKTEQSVTNASTSGTISLLQFVTTPHLNTKNSMVEMVVMGNYFPSYENVAGIGYHKLICADVKNKNMMKPIVVYTKAQIDTDNILNNDNLKRGSVIHIKGDALRCKAFGTKTSDNFSEKVKRPVISESNKWLKSMEDAICNYRGAAEKTFTFTKPQEEFRKIDDDSIERNNYRLTAPLQMELSVTNNIRKMKQLSWTEIADFLEKFAEFERGTKEKMCVDSVLFTVLEVTSENESSGVVLIGSEQKKGIFFIPDVDVRKVNIPVEQNSTYFGIIRQKSAQDNLHVNYEGSVTLKMDWIERVDEPYLEDLCDLDQLEAK